MSTALNVRRARVHPTTAHRILVAMTEHERKLFGLEDLDARLPSEQYRWVDAFNGGKEAWQRTFAEVAPTILLASWSTPSLEQKWQEEGGSDLRYVCQVTGSVRHVVQRLFLERGGLVSNWGGQVAPQVAEHALLLALSALRNAAGWTPFLRDGVQAIPKEWLQTRTLFGRRVGIHGFGSVARSLVALLQPFNVKTEVYAAGVPSIEVVRHGATPSPSLQSLFGRSEVVFECEALNETSRRSVSAEVLAALPDGAVLVNVGRGLVIDEAALLREVQSRRIWAAVDVLSEEPIPSDSPFLGLPQAVVSPHIAGPTLDRLRPCGDFACRNVARFIGGETPEALLTLDVYDRST